MRQFLQGDHQEPTAHASVGVVTPMLAGPFRLFDRFFTGGFVTRSFRLERAAGKGEGKSPLPGTTPKVRVL